MIILFVSKKWVGREVFFLVETYFFQLFFFFFLEGGGGKYVSGRFSGSGADDHQLNFFIWPKVI